MTSRGKLPLPEVWDGTAEGKLKLHKDITAVFREVARALDLTKSDFEVDSNPCGPAIGGYVYLRADAFHLWADCGSRGEWGEARALSLTARRTKSRDDHAGSGPNVMLDWELLWDPQKLAEVLILEGVGPDRASFESGEAGQKTIVTRPGKHYEVVVGGPGQASSVAPSAKGCKIQ